MIFILKLQLKHRTRVLPANLSQTLSQKKRGLGDQQKHISWSEHALNGVFQSIFCGTKVSVTLEDFLGEFRDRSFNYNTLTPYLPTNFFQWPFKCGRRH